jgi:hypothetical protein
MESASAAVRGVRRWRSRALASAVVFAAVFAAFPAWGAVEEQPTAQEVAQARRRAEQLRATASGQADDLASARSALGAAAAASALALEAYRSAAEAQRAASVELARREHDLEVSEASVARARAALVRWARTTYVDGGTLGTSPGVYTLFTARSTDAVGANRAWLRHAGQDRAGVLAGLQEALGHRQRATDDARHAIEAAEAVTVRADAARAARDAVLDAQRRRLADLHLLSAGTRAAADAAGLAAARMSAGLFPGPGGGNRVTGPVGDCAGGDVSAYGNGQIPLSALCPLPVPSGGWLRADAAYAFGRLAAAFAVTFGRPLCLTDSYRSYDEQVRVRAARPGLAATPGRSNHGWGTAADLCGGIERFGTAEHRWMLLNAPLFGWFHPAWARAGGSMPEAWHWEFSG